MIILFILMILAGVALFALACVSMENIELSIPCLIIGFSLFFFGCILSLHYSVSQQRARIVNEQYHKNYSTLDMMLYGDTIVDILKIEEQKVEIKND